MHQWLISLMLLFWLLVICNCKLKLKFTISRCVLIVCLTRKLVPLIPFLIDLTIQKVNWVSGHCFCSNDWTVILNSYWGNGRRRESLEMSHCKNKNKNFFNSWFHYERCRNKCEGTFFCFVFRIFDSTTRKRCLRFS